MEYESIDMAIALEQLGGSEKLYKTVVKGFYERYREVDQVIAQHLNSNDPDEARRIAHSMKGLCGNLGALKLRKRALDLEMAIRNRASNIDDHLNSFSKELTLVIDDVALILREHYQIQIRDEQADDSRTAFCTGIKALINALDTYRYTDIEAAAKQIKEMAIPEEMAPIVNAVFEEIEKFEYDKAIEIVRKVC